MSQRNSKPSHKTDYGLYEQLKKQAASIARDQFEYERLIKQAIKLAGV